MKTKILYTKPSITELEIRYATDAATNGWGEHCYEYIHLFEERFKDYVKAKYAIATSSCTGATHLGLAALGISAGDEVVLADINWIASAAPITYLGAKPIFVDILPNTWCIDPNEIESSITEKTKAIIAVHLYGNVCELDRIIAIGEKYNIPVIEDAAEGIGSYWRGRHVGSVGSFGVYSFHGTKTITTGEGGMFVTNDEYLYNRVMTLNNHGRRLGQAKQFWAEEIGYKYKISNIQAALGCAQMERIDDLVRRKREIFMYYANALSGIPEISLNPELEGTINGYWMPTAVFSKESGVRREQIQAAFNNENIDARVFFWPLSSLPMFTARPLHFNSYDIPNRSINLPSYHDITKDDMDRVVAVLVGLLHG